MITTGAYRVNQFQCIFGGIWQYNKKIGSVNLNNLARRGPFKHPWK